jgi:hypothetical protein
MHRVYRTTVDDRALKNGIVKRTWTPKMDLDELQGFSPSAAATTPTKHRSLWYHLKKDSGFRLKFVKAAASVLFILCTTIIMCYQLVRGHSDWRINYLANAGGFGCLSAWPFIRYARNKLSKVSGHLDRDTFRMYVLKINCMSVLLWSSIC